LPFTFEEFEKWSMNDPFFRQLYADWEASGFIKSMAPSITRTDLDCGYPLWNLDWYVFTENGRRAKMQMHYGIV
jgi:hypothetical protein